MAKIGRQKRCQSIAREAWFYDEMKCLQGALIARCYGCFELKLEKGCRVNPWEHPQHTPSDMSPDKVPEFAMYPEDALDEAGILPHPLLTELLMARDRVFVLILEKLGNELSGGYVYPERVR